ncbi:MAG: hypothetical protein V5A20_10790 [Salinibacter sp.]|uniref:hypothetical protein n=1 Tax=Salinibacter sp. TaxID=2065818 RepID=UPI002FC3A69E
MDASPLFNPEYLPIIAGTLIGFALLAALLLVPIWRFLDREQEVAEEWTAEAVEERILQQKQPSSGEAEASDEGGSSTEQGSAVRSSSAT